MNKRLPVIGSAKAGSAKANARSTLQVSTLMLNGAPLVAVIGSNHEIPIRPFVDALIHGAQRRGLEPAIETSSSPLSNTRLLVIVGSHVPRALRHPEADALWARADLLLSTPSTVVAEALAAAL